MKSMFIKSLQIKKSSSWIKLFSIPVNLRVTLVTTGVLTIFELSGDLVMSNYVHTILKNTGLNVSLLTTSIILSATHLIPNILGAFIIECWGRKPLFVFLCTLSAIGHYIIALSMFLMDNTDAGKTKLLGIFEVLGVIFFELAVGFGFIHMPFTLGAELYPTNIKSKGLSLLKIIMSGEAVLVVQMFEFLTNINPFIPFCCMAVASSIGVVFGIVFVPETKSKSLARIQEDLNLT